MSIVDIFSKRQKRASGQPEIYGYDEIPRNLLVQIVYILTDLIGTPNVGGSPADKVYESIVQTLRREYGRQVLGHGHIAAEELFNFVANDAEVAEVLDAVEVSFDAALQAPRMHYNYHDYAVGVRLSFADAIKELNTRFQEAAVGYQYENGRMIRIDSLFVHAEIVKPALSLLSDKRYSGAQEEFLNAHKHYREGNHKECLTDCLKAFESILKTICDIRKWPYHKTDTARTLIDICFKNGLIPSMLQAQLSALQTILESGVPTLRNKLSGHGQGSAPIVVPQHLAAYTLHLTAANIVLLVNAAKP